MNIEQCLTVFAIVATNLGTVLSLYFQTDKKLDLNRREFYDKSEQHRKEIIDILMGMQQEMKDFHGRLCSIEERNKGGK